MTNNLERPDDDNVCDWSDEDFDRAERQATRFVARDEYGNFDTLLGLAGR